MVRWRLPVQQARQLACSGRIVHNGRDRILSIWGGDCGQKRGFWRCFLWLQSWASRSRARPSGPIRRGWSRTADGVVGASISHPEGWALERESYTFDKTYGFTLWRQGDAAADHGGTPAVRVALAYGLSRAKSTIASGTPIKITLTSL